MPLDNTASVLDIANKLADMTGIKVKPDVTAAITNKGVATSSNDNWTTIVNNINSIARGQGNAIESNVLAPKTFTNSDGVLRTGTMANASAETKAVSLNGLTNILTNSNFDNGSTDWIITGTSTSSVVANELIFTANALYGQIGQAPIPVINGHKYYAGAWVKTNSNALGLYWQRGDSPWNSIVTASHSGSGNYEYLSGIGTASETYSNYKFAISDGRSSGWTETRFKQCMLIDLTAAFGAGNEPTNKVQMDAVIGAMGGHFKGSTVIANINTGAYLTAGITGKPDILISDDNLKPENLIEGKIVFGVTGIKKAGGLGNTLIVGSSHPATNAPVDLASIRLEFYNRVYPNNLGAIQVLKDGITNVFSNAVINTNNTANATDEDSVYITINENMYPGKDYKVVLPIACMKDKLGNGLCALEYSFHTNPTPSTWAINPAGLSIALNSKAGCGTQDAGLAFGGYNGSLYTITEKFNGTTWSTTGNLTIGRHEHGGAGTQDAGLAFGGYNGGVLKSAEKFNGATWSAVADMPSGRDYVAGCGVQNAGLAFGGQNSSPTSTTYKFDGSTWSTTGNLNKATNAHAGAGTQNAGLSFGGYNSGYLPNTEKFNGATWSTTGNLITARRDSAGCGAQDAALSFGGSNDSGPNGNSVYFSVTEKFNGSTWSSTGNTNTTKYAPAGCGTQTNGLCFGGSTNGAFANNMTTTEKFFG